MIDGMDIIAKCKAQTENILHRARLDWQLEKDVDMLL